MAEKWRSWGSRSVVGSGWLVVVGLVLIGIGLMGVVWVLLFVGCCGCFTRLGYGLELLVWVCR